ncbi:unnamed protein product [Lasius platythorax]|uniref:Uncharacterized protein n=1 Tax=Lasius platythorax TaxID=488582 RepID=A0AAV2MVW4_9HYME
MLLVIAATAVRSATAEKLSREQNTGQNGIKPRTESVKKTVLVELDNETDLTSSLENSTKTSRSPRTSKSSRSSRSPTTQRSTQSSPEYDPKQEPKHSINPEESYPARGRLLGPIRYTKTVPIITYQETLHSRK